MKATHTPGPRTIQFRGDLDEWHVMAEGGRDTIGRFFDRGDAVLDIAAPELLAACEKIVAWLDKLVDQAESDASTSNFETHAEACLADAANYRATANDVRVAIAKATQDK